MLTSMPFAELRVEGSVIALDENDFLPAAFRKAQKIGKGLRAQLYGLGYPRQPFP